MIIIPNTALAGSDNYLPTQGNFPGLAHLFLCQEAVGTDRMTDSVGGLVVHDDDAGGLIIDAGDGAIGLGGVYDGILSGTVASPGTKNVLVLMAGKPAATAGNITVGMAAAASNYGVRCGAAAGTRGAFAANGSAVGIIDNTRTGDNNPAVYSVQVTWGTNSTIAGVDYDGSTYTVRSAASGTITGAAAGIVTIDQAFTINTGLNPATIAVLYLTNPLSAAEQKAAVAWMYYALFTLGDKTKVLAPFLRGRN